MNQENSTLTQKGFSPIILLIAVSVIIGTVAIAYGYFIFAGKTAPADTSSQLTSVPLTKKDPLQSKVGTPDCPELDYTGCDTSGDFMTWTDDGQR